MWLGAPKNLIYASDFMTESVTSVLKCHSVLFRRVWSLLLVLVLRDYTLTSHINENVSNSISKVPCKKCYEILQKHFRITWLYDSTLLFLWSWDTWFIKLVSSVIKNKTSKFHGGRLFDEKKTFQIPGIENFHQMTLLKFG